MKVRSLSVLVSLAMVAGCDDGTANPPPLPTGGADTDSTGAETVGGTTSTSTSTSTGSSDASSTTSDASSTTGGSGGDTTTGEDDSSGAGPTTDDDTTSGESSEDTTAGETTGSVEGPDVSVLSGDAQTARINESLGTPIVFEVTDDSGVPLAGVDVTLTASPGAAISPAMAVSDGNGQVIALARVGRATGAHTFEAAADGGTSAMATATATEPDAQTLLSLVNADKVVDDNVGVPGPGTAANIGEVTGVATQGATVYVAADEANSAYVYALDAAGDMTVLAGGGAVQSDACIDPLEADLRSTEDVLYDATNDLIYVLADFGGWRLLELDLNANTLCTVAGGNADAPAPTYGDGGAATDARLLDPADIDIGADGALYVADRGVDRIRRVDGGVITAELEPGNCDDPVALNDCGSDGCEMAWDEQGNLFVSARICGTLPGGTVNGIVRYNPVDGALVHIAGRAGGSTAESALSFEALLEGQGGLTFDQAGNLYVIENQTHRVRRIDSTTFRTTTMVGFAQTAGALGDYGPALDGQLDEPARMVFSDEGDLIIADRDNAAVRMVWRLGEATATQASLGLVTSANPMAELVQPTLFTSDVVDGADMPLEGLRVSFEALDPGACVDPVTDLADDVGLAATFARPGLLAGDYDFAAVYEDLHGVSIDGSPVSMTISAADPAIGDALTLVNDAHVDGNAGVPGAGVCARVGDVTGVSATADGGVYFVDRDGGDGRLRRLDAMGSLVDVAGGGSDDTDGIPALDAELPAVADVQVDEANNRVFVTGTFGGASRVLRVNLASVPPRIFVYAGQPDALPGDGDGGLATSAHLLDAGDLAFDPTNPTSLYVVDAGHDRIRRIDGLTIDGVYGVADGACTDAIALSDCADCNIAFPPDGSAIYVFGRICGSEPGGNTPGIVRLDLDAGDSVTAIQHVAGSNGGEVEWDGVMGTAARFASSGGVVVADGGLYFAEPTRHRIGRLDLTTGMLSVVMGDGVEGSNGNHGPAVDARLTDPLRLDVRGGSDLLVADEGNHAVRMIWGLFP